MARKPMSAATKAKISAALKGKKRGKKGSAAEKKKIKLAAEIYARRVAYNKAHPGR